MTMTLLTHLKQWSITWTGIFQYSCCVTTIGGKVAQDENDEKRILGGGRNHDLKNKDIGNIHIKKKNRIQSTLWSILTSLVWHLFCTLADDRSSNLGKMCNEKELQCFLIRILAKEVFIFFWGYMNDGSIS